MTRRPALLDVNVLVALFDRDHVHHEAAHAWFGPSRRSGWATCPITENGLVRILSNASYTGVAEPPASMAARLHALCASGHHTFWPDDVSLTDTRLFAWTPAATHRNLTDIYLLGLARRHGGRLVTFDRTIPSTVVVGAGDEHLEVIPA